MPQPTEVRNTIIYRARHAYCSHPCVTSLANGDWLVAFSKSTQSDPIRHPPGDPQFINLMCRSRDQGQTWEQPRAVPGYDWHGVEVPGLVQLSNGDVLLNQWQFIWYPLETAKKLWLGEELECYLQNLDSPTPWNWERAANAGDWEYHPHPFVRADGGAYVHISADNGSTWDLTVPVDISPNLAAFSNKGAIQLRNGDVLLALGSCGHDPRAASFILRSTDLGRTWGPPLDVAQIDGQIHSEPSLVETTSGKILMITREETTCYAHQCESRDGGFTWTEPTPLHLWGYPPHCISLSDGRLLLIYGRRKMPFGIRASISEDEGETWGEEIILRDDLPNGNLGYPTIIEHAPGKLFAVYYGEDEEGTTHIQGTFFSI